MDDDEEYCCGCGEPMPERVAEWWLTSDGHMFCTSECAERKLVCGDGV